MKAVILAAGRGSRLGKITSNLPKPMITIDNKPILQYNLEMCKESGINDVFIKITTHSLFLFVCTKFMLYGCKCTNL